MNVPSSMTILNNQSALVEHSVAMLLLNKQLENAYNDHHNIKKNYAAIFLYMFGEVVIGGGSWQGSCEFESQNCIQDFQYLPV